MTNLPPAMSWRPFAARIFPAVLLASILACSTQLRADTLSSKFDLQAYGADVPRLKAGFTTDTLTQAIARVASRLAEVPGENGQTILPAGTSIDSIDVRDGWLTVFITVPTSGTAVVIDRDLVYQGMEVLRRYFEESAQLVGIKFFVRDRSSAEYVELRDYLASRGAVPMSAPRDTYFEPNGPGPAPDPDYNAMYASLRGQPETRNVSGQAPPASSGMPTGALAGRIIFTYGGHGRSWDGDAATPYWRFQRGYTNGMQEDFGNVDAADAFAAYCFNAGATVVPFRPIGYQNSEVIVDNPAASFSGSWSNSTSTRYYGSGSPPYRYASTADTESATATYTPNIPSAGYYPVYCWTRTGTDRVAGQLYRIRSTGGESLVRIDHRRVGNGWVYLGTYYFNAGSNAATGSVVISNLNPPGISEVHVVIADAIRFGNGMGDVNNGGGVSGYSRREESTVYWIQNGWGNGDTSAYPRAADVWNNANTADDENASWSAPPEMAQVMYQGTAMTDALYLGWHSNASAGTARGSVGLITSDATTNQAWWAARVSDQVDACSLEDDAYWEYTWNDRSASTYTGGYGEISDGNFGSKMDATIIEVAFHDNVQDAALLRDPKARNTHGRAAYRAAVQYFNNFQAGTLAYLPEPPTRFRAVNNGSGGVTLSWQPGPTGGTKGQAAASYRVYQSPDGLGFGAGTAVSGTAYSVNGLTAGQTYYFRVTGVNAGGESFPTDVLAVRVRSAGTSKILIVSAYDRIDRYNNVLRTPMSPAPEQLILTRNNTYNYVRQHAAAIASYGLSFDSCDNESVISNDIPLTNYQGIVWISGEESTADNTFNSTEQSRITAFINSGGKSLFVSGSEIGYELGATAFYNNMLAATYNGDDGGSYQATGAAGTIFAGITMGFSPSTTVYDADYPDQLSSFSGSTVAATYTGGGSGGAAVQFSGGSPTRKVVYLGFPFECIGSATTRNQVMAAAMTYFGITDTSGVPDWSIY